MKFAWVDERNGRSGIVAEPEEYDGVPWFNSLWLDASPESVHPDRIAVAAALAFGQYVETGLHFDRPVSVGVANAIRRFLGRPNLDISPVTYKQRLFATGSGRLVLGVDEPHMQQDNGFLAQWTSFLNVVRSDVFTGALYSSSGLTVASNAFLFEDLVRSGPSPRSLVGALPYLATACICAEWLASSALVVHCSEVAPLDAAGDAPASLRELLRATALSLFLEGAARGD